MSEDRETLGGRQFSREEVVDAYRPFVQKGITNPDDLFFDDVDVVSANALLEVWSKQEEAKARRLGNPEAIGWRKTYKQQKILV